MTSSLSHRSTQFRFSSSVFIIPCRMETESTVYVYKKTVHLSGPLALLSSTEARSDPCELRKDDIFGGLWHVKTQWGKNMASCKYRRGVPWNNRGDYSVRKYLTSELAFCFRILYNLHKLSTSSFVNVYTRTWNYIQVYLCSPPPPLSSPPLFWVCSSPMGGGGGGGGGEGPEPHSSTPRGFEVPRLNACLSLRLIGRTASVPVRTKARPEARDSYREKKQKTQIIHVCF